MEHELSDDPRVPGGEFAVLLNDIRACKERATCPELTTRALYFEPNPSTAVAWEESGRFVEAIDTRAVFVCESPSNWPGRGETTRPARCFAATGRDTRFWKIREQFGFANCYLTNSVKCGPRRGVRHSAPEMSACAPFLVRELMLIRPVVVVGVGTQATLTLRQVVLPGLASPPALHSINHYSGRGTLEDLFSTWELQFQELVGLLDRLDPKRQSDEQIARRS